MISWTTPTLELLLLSQDLTDHEITVSIAQDPPYGNARIDIGDSDLEKSLEGSSTLVTLTLTQEQTGRLAEGKASVMVNAIDSDGVRVGTSEAEVRVHRNLLDHSIEYGG